MSAPTESTSADPFGLQMLKPTKQGGQVWFQYNADFNDDPQVNTESASNEYVLHNIEDQDGTRFTISASDTFKMYLAPTTGLNPSECITDQKEMARRGYMQNPQDWRNVELTAQMIVFVEADDFMTFGFRGGKHQGSGAPVGCTASTYLVEISMKTGGLIRVRKKSWNTSIHNWLSTLVSGFDSTKPCGWTFKVLCINTQDAKSVTVEVWIDKENKNNFIKVLSGTDTGQINTDAPTCNCDVQGQPFTWGAPAILMQGNTGRFGFKNMSVREIEGFGDTLPPIDPGGGGGGGGTGGGTGGGGTGGGGDPVDLTPILATPVTDYVQYGGGPQQNPLEIYFLFPGSNWTKDVSTGPGTTTTQIVTANPIFAPKQTDYIFSYAISGESFYYIDLNPIDFYLVFAGNSWQANSTQRNLRDQIVADTQKVFNAQYFDRMFQYDARPRPTLKGFVTLTSWKDFQNVNTLTELSDGYGIEDIYNIALEVVIQNLLPEPTPTKRNIAYFVMGAPGVDATGEAGAHWAVKNDWTLQDGTHTDVWTVFGWGVVDGAISSRSSSGYGDLTDTITHELVEIVSDPIPEDPDTPEHEELFLIRNGTPLDSQVSAFGNEIADVCEDANLNVQSFLLDGVRVTKYWSDQEGSCPSFSKPSNLATFKFPWVSCPSGYTWNNTTQQCEKSVTTTTPGPIIASTALKNQVQNAMTTLFGTNYFTGLVQYGLQRRPILKSFVVHSSYAEPPQNYDLAWMSAFIDDAIAKNLVPNNSPTKDNIAYFIVIPPRINNIDGALSWHAWRTFNPTNAATRFHHYIASASMNQNFDDFSKLITAQLVNMISGQLGGSTGYSIRGGTELDTLVGTHGNNLGNVCFEDVTNDKIQGIRVNKYWSDQDGFCIMPTSTSNPTPYLSCHTGATYNQQKQICEKTPSPGGGGTGGTGGTGGGGGSGTGGSGGGTGGTGGTGGGGGTGDPGGTGGGPPATGGNGYTIVLANATGDDGHVPANAVDGKLDTRWSSFGKGEFLRLDLGSAKKVDMIKIAWYQGDKRSNHFRIATAEVQGGSYTEQLKQDSVKGSTGLQEYPIHPANPVRYIRIIVDGNTQNDWASISEAEVWGPDVPSKTPGTGTGGDPGSGGTTGGGDTGGGTQTPPPPPTPIPVGEISYNFFDTSFSVDYQKLGLCNPAE